MTAAVWHEIGETLVPRSESKEGVLPPLMIALTIVTGVLDAVAYLKLGHVFVANMTGNVVFLGFAAAGAQGLSVVGSLVALEVMTESPIGSPMLKTRAPIVFDLPEDAWFDIELMHKDIRLALATASGLNISLASAEVAEKTLTSAEELGYGQRDLASLYEVVDRLASDS